MEQGHGTQESGQFDRGQPAIEPRPQSLRQILDGLLKVQEPEAAGTGFGAAATELFRTVLGVPSTLVLHSHETKEHLHFGTREAEASASTALPGLVAKAIEAEQAVLDGSGSQRIVVVPILGLARSHGAFVVPTPELERRFGAAYLETLIQVGRYLGRAFESQVRTRTLTGGAPGTADSGRSLADAKQVFEKGLIAERLSEARGNIAAAARSLDMDRGQLSRLLKKHGIDKSSFRTHSAQT